MQSAAEFFKKARKPLSKYTWLLPYTLLTLLFGVSVVHGMTDNESASLRQDARHIFYHGLDNYRRYAYPEDELRAITCKPLTRDNNQGHFELNDVLGNYSLTVIDSLSTLAILASTPTSNHDSYNALWDFQDYTRLLIEEYGDGREGPSGRGRRARGFDLDSKVQVFETTIRGVGGLLSAHLFAQGDLPIRGYDPVFEVQKDGLNGTVWTFGHGSQKSFVYNGQLLRLAKDLAERLLPAFNTPTGLPYPRVNLRYGAQFYQSSLLNTDPDHAQCDTTPTPKRHRERTETCSAGAGSLVLEFTTLSRLTGDTRFEKLAKRAFWAVWDRRSSVGLIGGGIDAETGEWQSQFTGIGAGVDSFFEYAFKSYVLLSGLPYDSATAGEDSPEAFLQAWQDAHAANYRNIYRGPQFQHPHYAQNNLRTGGPAYAWIDSLSAYYPGLLVLAGELDEAISTHLLYTALWDRYGAMPERWNTITGNIDSGMKWWPGRPEFIESTWYLYHATQDPWYLYVGEMVIKDIKRRCFTRCGWAGLEDVRTGEQKDRMESFFLGETAKYLYLLFDPDHPLNNMDAPIVFTTEGHPLIIPSYARNTTSVGKGQAPEPLPDQAPVLPPPQCALPPEPLPFTVSTTAARPDVYHAAALARLHLIPRFDMPDSSESPSLDYAEDHPSISLTDVQSPSNWVYFPWTLPSQLIPHNATSAAMATRETFDLTFPHLSNSVDGFQINLRRTDDRSLLVTSFSGLRFGMELEPSFSYTDGVVEEQIPSSYRVYAISSIALNVGLGRDEHVYLSPQSVNQIDSTDPHFTRTKDLEMVDLIVDALDPSAAAQAARTEGVFGWDDAKITSYANHLGKGGLDWLETPDISPLGAFLSEAKPVADEIRRLDRAGHYRGRFFQMDWEPEIVRIIADLRSKNQTLQRHTVLAMLPTGIGAAQLPEPTGLTTLAPGALPYSNIFVLDDELCDPDVSFPNEVAKEYQIVVVKRGGCSFSEKIAKIPSFAPSHKALQMVIVVSFPEHEEMAETGKDVKTGIRPLLDRKQVSKKGVPRRNLIPLVMVHGGNDTWGIFERAATAVGRIDGGRIVVKKKDLWRKGKATEERPGMGVKRRFWFASQGIRISNLWVQ